MLPAVSFSDTMRMAKFLSGTPLVNESFLPFYRRSLAPQPDFLAQKQQRQEANDHNFDYNSK
jgi:hypothetical protein